MTDDPTLRAKLRGYDEENRAAAAALDAASDWLDRTILHAMMVARWHGVTRTALLVALLTRADDYQHAARNVLRMLDAALADADVSDLHWLAKAVAHYQTTAASIVRVQSEGSAARCAKAQRAREAAELILASLPSVPEGAVLYEPCPKGRRWVGAAFRGRVVREGKTYVEIQPSSDAGAPADGQRIRIKVDRHGHADGYALTRLDAPELRS